MGPCPRRPPSLQPPGQAGWYNAFIESFNGRLRDECLNTNWFYGLEHAREVIGTWLEDYNQHRPHSSLARLTPVEYEKQLRDIAGGLKTGGTSRTPGCSAARRNRATNRGEKIAGPGAAETAGRDPLGSP